MVSWTRLSSWLLQTTFPAHKFKIALLVNTILANFLNAKCLESLDSSEQGTQVTCKWVMFDFANLLVAFNNGTASVQDFRICCNFYLSSTIDSWMKVKWARAFIIRDEEYRINEVFPAVTSFLSVAVLLQCKGMYSENIKE